MRKMCSIVVTPLILFCGHAFGQTTTRPQLPPGMKVFMPGKPAPVLPPAPATFSPGQKFRYYTVWQYLGLPSPLQRGSGLLADMGDEAAADILLGLKSSGPLSAAQMQTAMDIVHMSFMRPRAIQNVADRKPTASLELLKKFQATAVDELVKERIAAEIDFLSLVPQTLPPLTLTQPVDPGPPQGPRPIN